uniref:Glycosyltransferase n=1 Tax=Crocus sativus TaxID=82528 RepID=I7ICE3_CROSA|nr:glucosyltransferase [Crocus sativus]
MQISLVFFPAWSAGHLTSMLEFSKLLLTTNADVNISITFLLIKLPYRTFSSASLASMESLSSSGLQVHFHQLPEVDLPENSDGPEDTASTYFQLYTPHVRAFLSSHPNPVSAFLIDFFATSLIYVATEFSVPTFVYFTSTALMLGLNLHLPFLEKKIGVEFGQVEGEVEIPGVVSVPPGSMPTPLMDKKSRNYTWFVYHGRQFREAKGIVVNSVAELEPGVLSAMAEGRFVEGGIMPTVYLVGPILSLADKGGGSSSRNDECLVWLDEQPKGSVLFLCFGSMGWFGVHQVREMATGLEQSGHRFLWSLRSMPAGDNHQPTDANLDEVLPEGFLERTKDRGMVWPSWVPQVEVLSHASVGGFVTHCGWNSVLESLWFGVPMIAWPQYAEQHLNEVELVRDMGVAVGMEVDRKCGNFVTAAELERGVRCLMGESEESRRVRAKVADMKVAIRNALKEGGSSYTNLKKLAKDSCC